VYHFGIFGISVFLGNTPSRVLITDGLTLTSGLWCAPQSAPISFYAFLRPRQVSFLLLRVPFRFDVMRAPDAEILPFRLAGNKPYMCLCVVREFLGVSARVCRAKLRLICPERRAPQQLSRMPPPDQAQKQREFCVRIQKQLRKR
jgi:hypothetical protein